MYYTVWYRCLKQVLCCFRPTFPKATGCDLRDQDEGQRVRSSWRGNAVPRHYRCRIRRLLSIDWYVKNEMAATCVKLRFDGSVIWTSQPNPTAVFLLPSLDPRNQIQSYVFDVVRSTVPRMDLDEAFTSKDEVATEVLNQLRDVMWVSSGGLEFNFWIREFRLIPFFFHAKFLLHQKARLWIWDQKHFGECTARLFFIIDFSLYSSNTPIHLRYQRWRIWVPTTESKPAWMKLMPVVVWRKPLVTRLKLTRPSRLRPQSKQANAVAKAWKQPPFTSDRFLFCHQGGSRSPLPEWIGCCSSEKGDCPRSSRISWGFFGPSGRRHTEGCHGYLVAQSILWYSFCGWSQFLDSGARSQDGCFSPWISWCRIHGIKRQVNGR